MEAKFMLRKITIQKGVNNTITSTSGGWDFQNCISQLKASSVLKRSVFLIYVIECFKINELEIELNTLLP